MKMATTRARARVTATATRAGAADPGLTGLALENLSGLLFKRALEDSVMTQARSPKPSGAPGVKTLITAASLAATLGGWALLALQQVESAAAVTPTTPPAQPNPVAALNLPPLPTIVPPPAQSAVLGSASGGAGSDPGVFSVAPPPAPADLRVVSAPPPVTNTQSSRP